MMRYNAHRLTVAVTSIVAAALLLSGCTGQPSGSDTSSPLIVGTAQSLTGDYQALGVAYRAGAQYAVDAANANGGVGGRQVQLDVRDDQSKPEQAAIAVGGLVDSSIAILGPGGANTAQASADIAQRAGVPLVSPSGFSVVSAELDHVYEVSTSSGEVGKAMADYAAANEAKTAFAVVNTDDGGMQTGWAATDDALTAAGVDVIGTANVGFTTTDYSAALAQIGSAKPDLVIAWLGGPPAVAFANQFTAQGLSTRLLMSNAVAAPYYYGSGAGVSGTLVATALPVLSGSLPPSAYTTSVQELSAKFEAAQGSRPDMFAFMGYAAMEVILQALRSADELTPEGVNKALSTLQLDTAMGPIAYSAGHHGGPDAEWIAISKVEDATLKTEPWSYNRLAGLLR